MTLQLASGQPLEEPWKAGGKRRLCGNVHTSVRNDSQGRSSLMSAMERKEMWKCGPP